MIDFKNDIDRKDWLIVILGSIFLSFGVTLPIGVILLIFVIVKQIKNHEKIQFDVNTDFTN